MESCQTSILQDKLHGIFVFFPLFSRSGIHASSRELLDYNNSMSFPLQPWNFRKVLLNTIISLQPTINSVMPWAEALAGALEGLFPLLVFFLQKQIFRRNTALYPRSFHCLICPSQMPLQLLSGFLCYPCSQKSLLMGRSTVLSCPL